MGQANESWTIIAVSFDQSTNVNLSEAAFCGPDRDDLMEDPR
jgi:hypothetical protein